MKNTGLYNQDPEPTIMIINAKLGDRGSGLKLVLPLNENDHVSASDPLLIKLIAQAYAAQDMVISEIDRQTVTYYGKRHLAQLLRISWLAPDITAAIIDGKQPKNLSGRALLRATNIPIDWAGQRKLFGFA